MIRCWSSSIGDIRYSGRSATRGVCRGKILCVLGLKERLRVERRSMDKSVCILSFILGLCRFQIRKE